MPGPKPRPLIERFLEKIEVNEENGCWEWTAFKDRQGYGKIKVDGEMTAAHRVSWGLHKGPIPEGLCVLHACDNPPCCNPEHLFLGTRTDNAEDKAAKGRHPKGEQSVKAKLKEHEVIAIKEMLARIPPVRSGLGRGILPFLARWFGVSLGSITDIHNGKNWAHL